MSGVMREPQESAWGAVLPPVGPIWPARSRSRSGEPASQAAPAPLLESVPRWVAQGARPSSVPASLPPVAAPGPPSSPISAPTLTASGPRRPSGPGAPRPEHAGPPSRVEDDDRVLAALCTVGHPNPPSSAACVRCGAPVTQGTPSLVTRPVLAQLVASTGQFVLLRGAVLAGRAPVADPHSPSAELWTLPSPTKDISRTHVRFDVQEWTLRVTDLHSTNGTRWTSVADPAAGPRTLVPGEATEVRIGDSIDVGDSVVIHVGPPR